MDAFISHSSKDGAVALKLEEQLGKLGIDLWVDKSDIRIGALLTDEIQDAIRGSRVVIVLWSKKAEESRWVNMEMLSAIHLDRYIIPCRLDDLSLPFFLHKTVYLDLRNSPPEAPRQLAKSIQSAPKRANPVPPLMRAESAELKQVIHSVAEGQEVVTGQLQKRDIEGAVQMQQALDEVMQQAIKRWKQDLMILNLDGYHLKNAYTINNWEAIQAGLPPNEDPLLRQAERRFLEAACIQPNDPSALNGLGSILTYRRDYEAAEFFIDRAIEIYEVGNKIYHAARDDKRRLQHYRSLAKKA